MQARAVWFSALGLLALPGLGFPGWLVRLVVLMELYEQDKCGCRLRRSPGIAALKAWVSLYRAQDRTRDRPAVLPRDFMLAAIVRDTPIIVKLWDVVQASSFSQTDAAFITVYTQKPPRLKTGASHCNPFRGGYVPTDEDCRCAKSRTVQAYHVVMSNICIGPRLCQTVPHM